MALGGGRRFFLFLLVGVICLKRRKAHTFFYACVNAKAPDIDVQIDVLRLLGADEQTLFLDRDDGRENYSLLKHDFLCAGDTLVIKSLYCLGEVNAAISRQIEFYIAYDIRLKVIDLPITMSDSAEGAMPLLGALMCQMLVLFPGCQPQPKPKKMSVFPDNWEEVCTLYLSHEIKGRKAMDLLGMKPSTFYKYVQEYKALKGM